MQKNIGLLLIVILVSIIGDNIYAQPTWTLDPFGKEKKPEKYEEKILASEKTGTKKFTKFRHFVQNNVTHYNFYFNANNKLNTVIERARLSHKDDYANLLTFYPYSLENTSTQQSELDSVIYKATAGILLHDLRNDWIDNMYLLIGKSYYFKNMLDSAALTFQFINYNLFPRKKNEDDSRVVGANNSATANVLSIANKEDRIVFQKALTTPPSRNDALIWLTRTYIDQQQYGDAAGLINILQKDPNLPIRLNNELEEVTAYWFYQQNNYDSAAIHLEKALSATDIKEDKARWEYLLGQLFENTGNYNKASDYYIKAARQTVNPIMDIYARLNEAKLLKNQGNTKELDNSIAKLLLMAKKDKYENYKDIIYYSTAQLSLQKPDTLNSIAYYKKSIFSNNSSTAYRDKSYLQLGNLAFIQKDYKSAFAYYDSLQIKDISPTEQQDIMERKAILNKLVKQILIIEKEDSLQRIAAMAPADRDTYIRKLVKKLRKENGLKEEDNFTGNTLITFNDKNASPDLFSSAAKGEWYFYNSNLKSKGFNEFRSKWGKRANVDNWRLKSATEAIIDKNIIADSDVDATPVSNSLNTSPSSAKPLELSYNALLAEIPLTTEQIDSSNKAIGNAIITLGKVFQNDLQNYQQAISTYQNYLKRYPDGPQIEEAYFNLQYCYNRLGNRERAAYFKNLLTTKFPNSAFTNSLNNPSLANPNKKSPEATKRYHDIYNMFIEGNFSEGESAKKKADSIYGSNYWTPQLLYLEAIHYIKQKNDSTAISKLNSIIKLYPASPLKQKASTMIDVLKRRKEIESYLTNLNVLKASEDKTIAIKTDSIKNQAPIKPIIKGTVKVLVKVPVVTGSGYSLQLDKPHFVTMVFNKTDATYINEAKNAFERYNRQTSVTQAIKINKDIISADQGVLVFSTFENADAALKYYDKIKKAAPNELSWFEASKYSFIIISEENLSVLKAKNNLADYKALLNMQYPNRF